VIRRHMPVQRELVEQRTLIDLPVTHHATRSRSPYLNRISVLGRGQDGVFQQNRGKAAPAIARRLPCSLTSRSLGCDWARQCTAYYAVTTSNIEPHWFRRSLGARPT
jgi:hypothetical protein